MLKWIFAPCIPAGQLPSESISISTILQVQAHLQQAEPGFLLGHILPLLLLCLGVCILYSTTFGWLGGWVENRLKKVTA